MKKLAAGLFLVFIILVIVTADRGAFPPFVRAIYHFPGGDKAGHFILYGILAFLLAWAFPRRVRWKMFSLARVILVMIVLVVLEEFSQRWFASRTFDLIDLAFSLLGIFAGDWLAGRLSA